MQISSRFTVALHIFACVDVFRDEYKVTSDFLAASINTNPVIIRNIHALLDDKLKDIQNAMEERMRMYTLSDLRTGMQELLAEEA